MTEAVLFYVYAFVAVAGAVGLVAAPKLIHGVMSLFATLFSIAALYLLLGSEFLAAMQLFVYGGAVTVLVLFVLMLTRPDPDLGGARPAVRWIGGVLSVAFFAVLASTLGRAQFTVVEGGAPTTTSIAEVLFSRYVLPFEIAGLVLTIALIGAIVLAREDDVLDEIPADESVSAEDGRAVSPAIAALEGGAAE